MDVCVEVSSRPAEVPFCHCLFFCCVTEVLFCRCDKLAKSWQEKGVYVYCV